MPKVFPHYWYNSQERSSPVVSNPGLLLDKYLPYRVDDQGTFLGYDSKEDQTNHLQAVKKANDEARDHYSDVIGEHQVFIEALKRQGCVSPSTITTRTIWVLSCDASRTSVVENGGLTFHPIYSFPYLKGETLKGLASSVAPFEDERRDRVFGTTSSGAGSVEFLDAWPVVWPEILVMDSAVHYSTNLHDSSNPITYSYLVVAPGSSFQVILKLRDSQQHKEDLDLAMGWLKKACTELGYGAKTGSAHGYMELVGE